MNKDLKDKKVELSEVEKAFSKMSTEQLNDIHNRSKEAVEFSDSSYGRSMLEQLKLWVDTMNENKKYSRLYNYEMEKEGRKLMVAAMADEIRGDAFQTIIDTVEQDIRMGKYAEKELKNRIN